MKKDLALQPLSIASITKVINTIRPMSLYMFQLSYILHKASVPNAQTIIKQWPDMSFEEEYHELRGSTDC